MKAWEKRDKTKAMLGRQGRYPFSSLSSSPLTAHINNNHRDCSRCSKAVIIIITTTIDLPMWLSS